MFGRMKQRDAEDVLGDMAKQDRRISRARQSIAPAPVCVCVCAFVCTASPVSQSPVFSLLGCAVLCLALLCFALLKVRPTSHMALFWRVALQLFVAVLLACSLRCLRVLSSPSPLCFRFFFFYAVDSTSALHVSWLLQDNAPKHSRAPSRSSSSRKV